VSRSLRLFFGIAVSVVCIWWATREVRPAEVWYSLRRADYRGFLAVMALTLLAFWVRAFRWRWMLSAARPVGFGSLYRATMIGFMANNLLPFRLGEFVRALVLARRERLPRTTVFATVVVERVVDMITLLAILGFALLLHPIRPDTEAGRMTDSGAKILMAGCIGLTVILIVLERRPGLMRTLVAWVAPRFPESYGRRAQGAIHHFVAGLSLFRDVGRLAWVFILSFVMFGMFALGLQVGMWAMHIEVPWYGGLLLLVITAVGIMVPAAPGYIGTMNLACVAGLALFSVGKDLSVPFSWFYWAGQWIPVSAAGLYCLRREGLSLRSLGRVEEDIA
jgi:uncharacterized protein (TIRG00374 family)